MLFIIFPSIAKILSLGSCFINLDSLTLIYQYVINRSFCLLPDMLCKVEKVMKELDGDLTV